MHSVLVLISARGALDHSTVAAARERLARLGAETGAADWLADGAACDLPFAGLDRRHAAAAVGETLAGVPVDLAALPTAGRRKRLLVADMESTVIANEMVDEMAEIAGIGPSIAAMTARTMAGELDFAQSLRQRAAHFAGRDEALLGQAATRMRVDPGARQLVATMGAHGASTALVSGGFSVFAEEIARRVGFDHCEANVLEVAAGRITGIVRAPILDGPAKPRALARLAAAHGLAPDDTLAVGDGANDVPMLRAAGLGIAYHGKPMAVAAADACIEHGDLTALLFLQGYRQDEFRDG